jgi:hypothetical protein
MSMADDMATAQRLLSAVQDLAASAPGLPP